MPEENSVISVTLIVSVQVDSTDDELLERCDESGRSFSVANVVSDEVRSNLESVSYVRHVSIEHIERT